MSMPNDMLSKHFAVLGTTGVGKSSGVVAIMEVIASARPICGSSFSIRTTNMVAASGIARNLINSEKSEVAVLAVQFRGDRRRFLSAAAPGSRTRSDILSEVIPLAKTSYLPASERSADRQASGCENQRLYGRHAGALSDLPILSHFLDDRMGGFGDRSFADDLPSADRGSKPSSDDRAMGFMFENANVGGDTMAEVLGQLFRLPPQGKAMAVMQLAGFPVGGRRGGGVGHLPHGFRLRAVERRRRADAVRLRGGASLRRRPPAASASGPPAGP